MVTVDPVFKISPLKFGEQMAYMPASIDLISCKVENAEIKRKVIVT